MPSQRRGWLWRGGGDASTVFPLFGLRASLSETLAIGAIFTFASIARSYVLRRTFEAIRVANAGRTGRRSDGDQAALQDASVGAANR